MLENHAHKVFDGGRQLGTRRHERCRLVLVFVCCFATSQELLPKRWTKTGRQRVGHHGEDIQRKTGHMFDDVQKVSPFMHENQVHGEADVERGIEIPFGCTFC